MSTTVVKPFSTSLGTRRGNNKPRVIQPEDKHHYLRSTSSLKAREDPVGCTFATQHTIKASDTPITNPNKHTFPTPSTSESDGLDYILDKFSQTALPNPNISMSSHSICRKVLKFIAKPNREMEYAQFFSVGQVEYDKLERFIEETSQINLKPRLTYIAEDNTLLVEMPSALHKVPFTALHSDFSDFFKCIPYNEWAITINIQNNICISRGIVPDQRIPFHNVLNHKRSSTIIMSGESAFSQDDFSLFEKLTKTVQANLYLLLIIAALLKEEFPFHSPEKLSPAWQELLSQLFLETSDDFIALMQDESPPALDVLVVVFRHTWCSLGSVEFKVWVHGDDQLIDIKTNDDNLTAEGTIYPEEDMDVAVAMIERGAHTMQQRLITFARDIEPDINIDLLQDPAITFQVNLEQMVKKLVSAMTETPYECYLAWYDSASKVLKGKKQKANATQIFGGQPANTCSWCGGGRQ
ncbi:hypothetical protein EDB19DRAFT_1917355 [Suillus lakei]|nr:hypothetical protein EDB19DRAFT_1917355 [Suillus lakei]